MVSRYSVTVWLVAAALIVVALPSRPADAQNFHFYSKLMRQLDREAAQAERLAAARIAAMTNKLNNTHCAPVKMVCLANE